MAHTDSGSKSEASGEPGPGAGYPRFLRRGWVGTLPRLATSLQRLAHNPQLRWLFDGSLLLEVFVTLNLAVLAADIVLAHSVNNFRNAAEFIPLYFSAGAPIVLLIAIALRWRWRYHAAWRDLGYLIGWLSVLIGLAGVLYHLQSSFFADRTLRSLTYAAPFAAPLAYAGLGFLLLANRMTPPRSLEWARWVIVLAAGGFFGNFVLCLTDHATNGFFMSTEWIPVITSSLATGFLIVPVITAVTRKYLDAAIAILTVQALTGLLGFWFHLRMNLIAPGNSLFEKSVNGAPPMAPLLFPNLVLLAVLGLWELSLHLEEQEAEGGLLATVAHWFAEAADDHWAANSRP